MINSANKNSGLSLEKLIEYFNVFVFERVKSISSYNNKIGVV